MIYPWLEVIWARLTNSAENLHHALLLFGQEGVGKRYFAMELVQLLLCDTGIEQKSSCGDCRSCQLFQSGTHPDFHLLATESETANHEIQLISMYANKYQNVAEREKRSKPSQIIPVDQVRALIHSFNMHSHISNHKVALILPADRMNINSANALLKLLEEPPENATLILVTSEAGTLLSTIRSRCFSLLFPLPSQAMTQAWLMRNSTTVADIDKTDFTEEVLSMGPLRARTMLESGTMTVQKKCMAGFLQVIHQQTAPLIFAESVSKNELNQFLGWCQQVIFSLVKVNTGSLSQMEEAYTMRNFSASVSRRLFLLYDKICLYKKTNQDAINNQLVIEDIAILASRIK